MIQLGVIYNWNSRLPPFEMFASLKDTTPFGTLGAQLEEYEFFSEGLIDEQNPLALISHMENRFFDKFKELLKDNLFFTNLMWLKMNMPQIRLKIRNDFLFKVEVDKSVRGMRIICSSNYLASNIFPSYVKNIKDWSGHTLFSLEKDFDTKYIEILKKSIGSRKGSLEKYVDLLAILHTNDSSYRNHYKIAEEGHIGSDFSSQANYQDLAQTECRYVNSASYTFDPDLIALQCYVRYRYFFSNLRVSISVPKEEKQEMLVNYNIH